MIEMKYIASLLLVLFVGNNIHTEVSKQKIEPTYEMRYREYLKDLESLRDLKRIEVDESKIKAKTKVESLKVEVVNQKKVVVDYKVKAIIAEKKADKFERKNVTLKKKVVQLTKKVFNLQEESKDLKYQIQAIQSEKKDERSAIGKAFHKTKYK